MAYRPPIFSQEDLARISASRHRTSVFPLNLDRQAEIVAQRAATVDGVSVPKNARVRVEDVAYGRPSEGEPDLVHLNFRGRRFTADALELGDGGEGSPFAKYEPPHDEPF